MNSSFQHDNYKPCSGGVKCIRRLSRQILFFLLSFYHNPSLNHSLEWHGTQTQQRYRRPRQNTFVGHCPKGQWVAQAIAGGDFYVPPGLMIYLINLWAEFSISASNVEVQTSPAVGAMAAPSSFFVL